MIGLFTLLCCVIQSAYDFVIIIPSNLILYTSIFAIVISVRKQEIDSLPSKTFGVREFAKASLIVGTTFVAGALAYSLSGQQVASTGVLAQTQLPSQTEAPANQKVNSVIAQLDRAIQSDPSNADLYTHRANWRLCEYRNSLIELATNDGIRIEWQNSRLEALFDILTSGDAEQRHLVLQEFLATPELRANVGHWISDIEASLRRQSYSPHNHLMAAMISPMIETPMTPWIKSASRLINNNDEMLFINGWIALKNHQRDEAVDQWKRSLSISLVFVDQIFERSQGVIEPDRIARELIPSRRSDLFVRLVRDSSEARESNRVVLAEKIVKILSRKEDIRDGIRFETIARIYQEIGRPEDAATAWENAVDASGRNLEYRHRYSLALRATGQLQRALDQASLASAIDSRDPRFPQLVKQIRREIGGGRSIR